MCIQYEWPGGLSPTLTPCPPLASAAPCPNALYPLRNALPAPEAWLVLTKKGGTPTSPELWVFITSAKAQCFSRADLRSKIRL